MSIFTLCQVIVKDCIQSTMFAALRVAFLYIGTSIGAGFSSGREIALFFGGTSPYCVALAAVFISILCGLFLVAGKSNAVPQNFFVKTGIFISSAISLCSMLAGGEYVLSSLFSVPLLGLAMAILGSILVCFGIEKIKWANTILMPLFVVLLFLVFFRNGAKIFGGEFSILQPIRYSGLDVLLGGVMLSREGKKMNSKQIVICCLTIFAFLSTVLFILQNVVLSDELQSSMPVLTVSERVGLKVASGVLIAVAIFTTLIGALEVLTALMQGYFEKSKKLAVLGKPSYRKLVVFGTLLLAYPISFLGFDNIVDYCYPFISLFGIIFTVFTLAKLIYIRIPKDKLPNFLKHIEGYSIEDTFNAASARASHCIAAISLRHPRGSGNRYRGIDSQRHSDSRPRGSGNRYRGSGSQRRSDSRRH